MTWTWSDSILLCHHPLDYDKVESNSSYFTLFRIAVISNDCGFIEPVLNTVSLHQVIIDSRN